MFSTKGLDFSAILEKFSLLNAITCLILFTLKNLMFDLDASNEARNLREQSLYP